MGEKGGGDIVFAVPGPLDRKSGGTLYDNRLIAELRKAGRVVSVMALAASFPFPSHDDLERTERLMDGLPDGTCVVVDGLAFGAMPQIAEAHGRRLRLVALVHHPLARETGLSEGEAARLAASERRSLGVARAVVATSRATADDLISNYGVPAGRLFVVEPGVDRPDPNETGKGRSNAILCVASLTPRKDHATLIRALARIADLEWTCRLVGDDRAAPQTAKAVREAIEAAGLGKRVDVAGPLDDLAEAYRHAGIFALASRYEGYGMVFAEAMAHGLPIVACRGGAIADVVPQAVGILLEPADDEAFAEALRRLLTNEADRRRLASGALATSNGLKSWTDCAAAFEAALREADSEEPHHAANGDGR